MFIYIIPLIVFLITTGIMYLLSNDPKKTDIDVILLRNALPGLVVGLLVYVIIKYKDSKLFNNEPLMPGGYFD